MILERGRERERNIDVREKHQLVTSHTCPDRGLNPQSLGVWMMLQPLGQGMDYFFTVNLPLVFLNKYFIIFSIEGPKLFLEKWE